MPRLPSLFNTLCILILFELCTVAAIQPAHLLGNSLCRCTHLTTHDAVACPQGYKLQPAAAAAPSRPARTSADAPPAEHTSVPHCCIPQSCLSARPTPTTTTPPQRQPQTPPPKQHHSTPTGPSSNEEAGLSSSWMAECCSHKLLRQVVLPGSHDSGTYRWTTPAHMPFLLDEILTVLFNIVGDLSRTQRLDVNQQLQAGARVLDIRLAINPWLAAQARAQQQQQQQQHGHRPTRRLESVFVQRAVDMALPPTPEQHLQQQQQQHTQPALRLDASTLEGVVDMGLGGPLSAAERKGCIVMSHSLPGPPLVTVLTDIRRFLQENPGELVVLNVKADTIDVNVAGSLRFTQQDWAAAAEVFGQELQGVQLVDDRQAQSLTLGQLAAGSRGGGTALLYSSELQQHGLTAVSTKSGFILESWFNGTNSEDLGDLKQRMVDWLRFWRSANWRQNRKPFLLLASAEVTLGVRTILEMVKNRVWHWQHMAAQQQVQQGGVLGTQHQQRHQQVLSGLQSQQHQPPQRRLLQHMLSTWQQLHSWLSQRALPRVLPGIQPSRHGDLLLSHVSGPVRRLAGGHTTLYQLGVETNQQMLQDVLENTEVPKDFSVWSMDAVSPGICSSIIALNNKVAPTAEQ